MKVSVKMSGLIARYLPGSEGGVELDIETGSTVEDLMKRLGLPAGENYLVIVNDATVPKARRGDHALSKDDRISIVPPLKGG